MWAPLAPRTVPACAAPTSPSLLRPGPGLFPFCPLTLQTDVGGGAANSQPFGHNILKE